MSISLLRNALLILLLTACAPAKQNNNTSHNSHQPVHSTEGIIDTTTIDPGNILANRTPLSLLDLPQSEEGDIILSDGFYEADFKSYCLQPGTPDPSERDAYLQAPLQGYRKDIIETILRNSLNKPQLEQKKIQLLLWSVVSGSNYNNLSRPVRSTATALLSSKQIFELKGGWVSVAKTVAATIPNSIGGSAHNDIIRLFELGNQSYEVYEKVAVLREPSQIKRPDYKKEQWYKQEGGYYARYFPNGYKQVKIQVYVPEGSIDSEGKKSGNYLLFDPVTLMAIPANSNAQRLGIGAPVVDIIRKVIQINKGIAYPKKQIPPPTPKNPKAIS